MGLSIDELRTLRSAIVSAQVTTRRTLEEAEYRHPNDLLLHDLYRRDLTEFQDCLGLIDRELNKE